MSGSDDDSFVSLYDDETTEQTSTFGNYEWDYDGFEFDIYDEEQEDDTAFVDIDEVETERISSRGTSDDLAILPDVGTENCMIIDFRDTESDITSSVPSSALLEKQGQDGTSQTSKFDEHVLQQSTPWTLSPQDMSKPVVDTYFLFDEPTPDIKTKEWIINLLESIFMRFLLSCTTTLGTFTMRLRSRATLRSSPKYTFPYNSQYHHILTGECSSQINLNSLKQQKWKSLTYPGKVPRDTWRFACLMRVLNIIHELLTNDTVITKRFDRLISTFSCLK